MTHLPRPAGAFVALRFAMAVRPAGRRSRPVVVQDDHRWGTMLLECETGGPPDRDRRVCRANSIPDTLDFDGQTRPGRGLPAPVPAPIIWRWGHDQSRTGVCLLISRTQSGSRCPAVVWQDSTGASIVTASSHIGNDTI